LKGDYLRKTDGLLFFLADKEGYFMSYIISKNDNVRLDIMIVKKYQPQLIGYMRQYGCTYDREVDWKSDKDNHYVILKDVKGEHGRDLGEVIGLFYSLEWNKLIDGSSEDKFYITLNARRRAKDHAGKDRKETGEGRDGGNE
jgi:hypothetical protein